MRATYKNWAWNNSLKRTLHNIGMDRVYETERVGIKDNFMATVKQRIRQFAVAKTNEKIENSSKADLFWNITADLGIKEHSKYLDILEEKNAITLAKFRTRNYMLANEIGSWLRLPDEDKVCTTCLQLEDEEHVIYDCVRYDHIREKYLKFHLIEGDTR